MIFYLVLSVACALYGFKVTPIFTLGFVFGTLFGFGLLAMMVIQICYSNPRVFQVMGTYNRANDNPMSEMIRIVQEVMAL